MKAEDGKTQNAKHRGGGASFQKCTVDREIFVIENLSSVAYNEVVSNRWTGLWTGSLDWIAGLDSE